MICFLYVRNQSGPRNSQDLVMAMNILQIWRWSRFSLLLLFLMLSLSLFLFLMLLLLVLLILNTIIPARPFWHIPTSRTFFLLGGSLFPRCPAESIAVSLIRATRARLLLLLMGIGIVSTRAFLRMLGCTLGCGFTNIAIFTTLLLLRFFLGLILLPCIIGGGISRFSGIGEFLFGFQIFCVGDVNWSVERAGGVVCTINVLGGTTSFVNEADVSFVFGDGFVELP
mmetsp:Transcript_1920/g.3927  ORF Transcript_1920/g.3927 Transcript_1920/m.3927 type:complete len:226 (+) Transcript_1920:415-1092(+)